MDGCSGIWGEMSNFYINYKTVNKPEDFLLFSLKNRNGEIDYKSDFFHLTENGKSLILKTEIDNLYPEIYLEFTLSVLASRCGYKLTLQNLLIFFLYLNRTES